MMKRTKLRMLKKLMKNGGQASFAPLRPLMMVPELHYLKPASKPEEVAVVEEGLKDAPALCFGLDPHHPLDCCHCFLLDLCQQMVDNLMA